MPKAVKGEEWPIGYGWMGNMKITGANAYLSISSSRTGKKRDG